MTARIAVLPRFIHRLVSIVAVVAALTAFAPRARATVVMQLSTAEMTQRSDLVVRARVVAQSSRWSDDGRHIVTLTRVHVAEFWKGQGAGDLVLRQYGGTVGTLHSAVAGDGRLTVGEECVLFLRNGPGVVFLVALAQSVYHVTRAVPVALAQRDLTDLTFARREQGRIEIVPHDPAALAAQTPIAQLENDVRSAARASR